MHWYHTLPYSITLYHTVPYCIILYHLYSTILYHTLPYSTILYHTLPYFTIHYHTLPYCTILYSTILYHTVPYFTLPYCTLPYCTLPYSTIALSCLKRLSLYNSTTCSNSREFPCSLSDRSFNDIMQYPVMPWIIADYTSQTLGRYRLSLTSTKTMVALGFLAEMSTVTHVHCLLLWCVMDQRQEALLVDFNNENM